jgi:cytochrome c553
MTPVRSSPFPRLRSATASRQFEAGLLVVALIGGALGTADERVEFFETKVRPALLQHCGSCHGEKKQESGLRLDRKGSLFKGGDSGTAIVPGKPDESLLIKSVRYAGDYHMPPSGKLPAAVIADLERWVKDGAAWPEEKAATVADPFKTHWAFQPVRDPAPPKVDQPNLVRNPIDAFILDKLKPVGLSLNPEADRRTLLRRLSWTLTGLPPDPKLAAEFLAERSTLSVEGLVDRLLASPAYGERQARQWMDVARYADTKGYVFTEDRNYYFAWTYRDWLIDAFNRDEPYDRFLQKQLAADLMPDDAEGNRKLAAMGFLTVGRRFLNDGHEIIDDRIDLVSRGLAGITVSCARCHDHKYDPVSQADYYGLYGMFNSSVEPPPQDLPALGDPPDTPEGKQYRAEVAQREERIKTLSAGRAGKDLPRDVRNQVRKVRDEIAALSGNHPGSPARAMALKDGPNPHNVGVFLRGNPGRRGAEAPRGTPAALNAGTRRNFKTGSGRLEFAESLTAPTNPLTARFLVNRVWLLHFGAGLVRTPTDFGLRSDPPTHPELLDWLATRFVREEWSIKKLHRLILTSATWRQSGALAEKTLAADPENRLWSRFPRRRLDWESLRDGMLASSDHLDRRMHGRTEPLTGPNPSRRRAVYGRIDRQNLEEIFRTFDLPSPNVSAIGRTNTLVPQQGLFLLNSGFANERAAELGGLPGDDETWVSLVWSKVLGRAPSAGERSGAKAWLQAESASPDQLPPVPWRYGLFKVTPDGKRVDGFRPLEHFVDGRWQGGDSFPDPNLAYAMVASGAGHTGRDLNHAVGWRWTAPAAMAVRAGGRLSHDSKEGTGVRGWISSSRQGVLGSWTVKTGRAEARVRSIAVTAGETLDFVVDSNGDDSFDSFQWSPTVNRTDPAPAGEDLPIAWDSAREFSGSMPTALSPRARLALALFTTNEFLFVD